ncbi:hypothetical protein C8R44DRAFT_851576 [Mycena epipterygia]|nr:hypothetical protein C8R44DRAFT_851576 [Mycena epipterygia]
MLWALLCTKDKKSTTQQAWSVIHLLRLTRGWIDETPKPAYLDYPERELQQEIYDYAEENGSILIEGYGWTLDCGAADGRLPAKRCGISLPRSRLAASRAAQRISRFQEIALESGWVQLVRKSDAGDSNSGEQVDGLGGVLEPSTRRGLDGSQRSTRLQHRSILRASEHGADLGVPPSIQSQEVRRCCERRRARTGDADERGMKETPKGADQCARCSAEAHTIISIPEIQPRGGIPRLILDLGIQGACELPGDVGVSPAAGNIARRKPARSPHGPRIVHDRDRREWGMTAAAPEDDIARSSNRGCAENDVRWTENDALGRMDGVPGRRGQWKRRRRATWGHGGVRLSRDSAACDKTVGAETGKTTYIGSSTRIAACGRYDTAMGMTGGGRGQAAQSRISGTQEKVQDAKHRSGRNKSGWMAVARGIYLGFYALVRVAGQRAAAGGDAVEVNRSRMHAAPDAEDAQGERESREHRRCHRQRDRTQPTISRRRRELAHLCHDGEEKRWEVLNVNSSTLPALDARVCTADSSDIEGERRADETGSINSALRSHWS